MTANTTSTQNEIIIPPAGIYPHDLDAERAVLGAVLAGSDKPEDLDLQAADFYRPAHGRIWAAGVDCEAEHGRTDAILVKDTLARCNDRLPELGGLTYLADLVGDAPVAGDAKPAAAIVRRHAAARRAVIGLLRAKQQIEEGRDPAEALAGISTPTDIGGHSARRAIVTTASQVQIIRPEFTKIDWYPTDVVTIIAGRGGEGKSSLALADVAAGTRGELIGDIAGRPIRSLLTAPEDSKAVQAARLKAAGADPDHWGFLDIGNECGGDTVESTPRIPSDIDIIREALIEFRADLWVIDPITAVIPGDLNKRDVVRAGLDPLTRLARELHIAVVTIMHFNKGGGYASDKLSGSAAFRDAARSVLLVAHDKESDERVITVDKSNYSDAQGKSWSFRLDSVTVTADNGLPMEVPLAVVTGESDTDVERIINRSPTTEGDSGEDRNAAQAFLLDYLRNQGGEAPAVDTFKAGRLAGFEQKDLQNARARLRHPKVASQKSGFGKGWVWAIVDEELTKDSKDSHHREASSSSSSVSSSVTDLHSRRQLSTCAVCHQPMKIVESGQTCHPGCTPSGGAAS